MKNKQNRYILKKHTVDGEFLTCRLIIIYPGKKLKPLTITDHVSVCYRHIKQSLFKEAMGVAYSMFLHIETIYRFAQPTSAQLYALSQCRDNLEKAETMPSRTLFFRTHILTHLRAMMFSPSSKFYNNHCEKLQIIEDFLLRIENTETHYPIQEESSTCFIEGRQASLFDN